MFCACLHSHPAGTVPAAAGAAAASDRAACERMAKAWPALNAELQRLVTIRDKDTYMRSQKLLEHHLAEQPTDACPVWQEPLARLRALGREFEGSISTQHAADAKKASRASQAPEAALGGLSQEALERRFVALHQTGTEKSLLTTTVAWQIWQAEHDAKPPVAEADKKQRYVANMGCDAALVQDDGQVGHPVHAEHYVALVKTAVTPTLEDRLVSLQGQGPLKPSEAARYVGAALKLARGENADRVVFVNTAGGQIPSFKEAVTQSAVTMPHPPLYIEYDGWRDGTLVTPQMAATFATQVAHALTQDTSKSMLVVNCNAGQDRSGIINALTQLIIQAEAGLAVHQPLSVVAQQGYDAIDGIVANLKAARPYAISSSARYIFIYRSYSAYLRSVSQTSPTPSQATQQR